MEKDNESRISQSMVVKGIVECQGRLVLEGVLEGSLSGGRLTIAESGRLTGEVRNREVECFGHLQGDIVTESFILRHTGFHMGTAETCRLTVDPGAVLDCVMQSSMTEPGSRVEREREEGNQGPGFELCQVLSAFQEGSRPCCMDIPWSARLALFNQLLAILQKGKSVVEIVGEAGSGKSVLVAKLCRNPPAGCEFLVIDGSEAVDGLDEMLRTVASSLALAGVENLGPSELPERIRAALEERRRGGERVVLLVDRAEAMEPAVLEGAIRFLTNAFDGGKEALQLVLFGTRELEATLPATLRDYFKSEAHCRLLLAPLSLKDTADYLRFCLQLAAAGNGSVSLAFLPYETIRTIHILSRGKIAEINRLADLALQKANGAGAQAIYPDFL